MRIAYISGDPGIPVLGDKGAAVHVRELIGGFRSLGHDVTLFAARRGQGEASELDVPLVHVAAAPACAAAGPGSATHAREWAHVAQHTAWMDILAAHHARQPVDLVYERYSLWTRAGSAFARRRGIPHVVEVNSPLRDEQRRYRDLSWDTRAARVERVVFGAATAVVAVSDEVARYVRTRTVRPGRVHVVENGVDLERYRTSAPYARRDGFRVGFLGSLKPWHGVDVLISAAARTRALVPHLQVIVVGDGPERAALERQARALGVADVVAFVGSVPKRDVPAWLASMDVATAPYPALDGFYFSPLKLYDYLAAGRPIVASRVGAIPDVLRDGDTGLLVTPGDADALGHALVRLARIPALAERLGRAARADAFARHGWDARARAILALADDRNRSPATVARPLEVVACHAR